MLQYGNTFARELGECIKMYMCIMCGMHSNKFKQPNFVQNSAEDSVYFRITGMISEGKFNEAENEMFEILDETVDEDFYIMLCIYDYMNDFEDEFMEQNNYSRVEIRDGITRIRERFDRNGIYNFLKEY